MYGAVPPVATTVTELFVLPGHPGGEVVNDVAIADGSPTTATSDVVEQPALSVMTTL
jgi:hypothetical protein